MPQNFPEMWLDRVIQNLDNSDQATFLNGIGEINAPVQQIHQGQPTEKNIIYVPTTDFEVDILINNNSYPIPFQEYTDDTISITLDKYQTKVVTLSDDQTIGASYDIIDKVTKSMTRGLTVDKYKRAIHSIAPLKMTPKTPVLKATGGEQKLTTPEGRPRLVYEDLVAAREACEGFGQMRLVLCQSHWNDLLLDRKNFGNQLINYSEGKPNPKILGFEIHQYDGSMPLFTKDLVKKTFGTIKAADDREASIIFNKEGIAKKTGFTKQYFAKAADNPARQSNDLSYRHYFIVTPYKNEKIAAII